jgi:hypothetical protein
MAAAEAAASGAALSALERARAFLAHLADQHNYDGVVLEGLTVEEASPGRVVCALPITEKHANR